CAIGLWGVGSGWTEPGRLDEPAVALLEEALDGLGPEDSTLRARALATLVRILASSNVPAVVPKAMALGREALAMARRVGSREFVADALFSCWFAFRGPDHLAARQEITTEWLQIARTD